MRRVQFGDGAEEVVLILGFGNRPEHDGVQWLIDHLTAADYTVTAFEIPRTITDFEAEYLAPVVDYVEALGSYRVVSHSTGGLIARYLDDGGVETRTYLSPWWGFHDGLDTPLVRFLMKLPLSKPILPASASRAELGELATDEWVADAPDYASPTFLREAKRAQESIPPFDEDDVVFYNPGDKIVGTDAIEAQSPSANRIQFDGGHELFCSRSRADHVDALLAAVEGGLAALED
ncbi:MAG: alpha/beta hydrolase [Halopenitus sp.]